MRAGELRHWVDFYAPVHTLTNGQDVVTNPTLTMKRPCFVEPVGGGESVQSQQVTSTVSHSVTTRYFSALGPEWILKYNGRTLQIVSMLNVDERNREWRLSCAEVL